MISRNSGCLYASQKSYLKDSVSTFYKPVDNLIAEGAGVIGNIYDNPELLEG